MRLVVAKTLFQVYRGILSPLMHWLCGPLCGCRFVPTCSQYAEEAVTLYGITTGLKLTLYRLFRCHPFARSGYDPVPYDIAKPCKKSLSLQGR